VLASLEMGFLPVPGLSPKEPSTSFKVRGRALRVDLLTPATGRPRGPVRIHRFGAAAEPMPHLDVILEDFQSAAVIDGGGILVNVPHPARFALHKLMVSRSRPAAMQTKSGKDVDQAAQLIRVLARDRPGDLEVAWEACARRGPGWTRAITQGLAALRRRAPDAAAAMDDLVRSRK